MIDPAALAQRPTVHVVVGQVCAKELDGDKQAILQSIGEGAYKVLEQNIEWAAISDNPRRFLAWTSCVLFAAASLLESVLELNPYWGKPK